MNDMVKNFASASGAAITIIILSILFNIVRAFLSDKTTISLENLINTRWIWNYKYYIGLIFIIGIVYFASSMLMTQFSSNMSLGRHTATFTFLIFIFWSTIFIPINLYVFNIRRKEHIPSIYDRFWVYIGMIILLNFVVALLIYKAVNRLQLASQI